jgi:hypothetical protein
MSEILPKLFLVAAIVAFWIGIAQLQGGRTRRRSGQRRAPAPWGRSAARVVSLNGAPDASHAAEQLRIVAAAQFEKRRLLSRSEAQFLYAAEKAIADRRLTWRVMAQVSLGEVLSSPDPDAYRAINSKRVDLLIISRSGEPIAAIEYQGSGHYQGTAAMRDAVKKEALRRAGVRYIEMTPEHGPEDVVREIARIAEGPVSRPPPTAVPASG